jgi:phenylalanyl-tRNA synthetase beta chain
MNYKLQKIVATQLNSQGFNEMNSLTTASYIELSEMLKRRTQCDNVEPVE